MKGTFEGAVARQAMSRIDKAAVRIPGSVLVKDVAGTSVPLIFASYGTRIPLGVALSSCIERSSPISSIKSSFRLLGCPSSSKLFQILLISQCSDYLPYGRKPSFLSEEGCISAIDFSI